MVEQMEFEKEQLQEEYEDLAIQFDGYQDLDIKNDSLQDLLSREQQRVQDLLEELRITRATNARRIAELKKELATVRSVMVEYVHQIDSLNRTNEQLTRENKQLTRQFNEASNQAQQLQEEKTQLTAVVQRASMLELSDFHVSTLNKRDFTGKVFTPLSRDSKLVLMTRAEFGYLGHFNKDAKSPFESFYMGGDGMSSYTSYSTEYVGMRGYTSGSLTPYDPVTGRNMGYLYNKFTMELRYPVCLEQQATIWLLGFLEAGNCFADIKDYNPFNLKRSAGVGVRVFPN